MIEQSVSLASNGVVKVPGYEQLVRFGYTKNRGVYRLAVTASGEWAGLTIRCFWHVPDGKDPASSLVVDGYVDVPASVTAQPGSGCVTFEGSDGTKGCHWTLEQTQDVAKQRNITCDPNDFWAVMNMMYSDYCQVAKRQSVDTPGFYADMAKAFLEDTDAADGKAYLYWDCIADK